MEIVYQKQLYNNAVESIDVSQLNYQDDQKKEIYLFSQLNAVENFATEPFWMPWMIQVALVASTSKGVQVSVFQPHGIEKS